MVVKLSLGNFRKGLFERELSSMLLKSRRFEDDFAKIAETLKMQDYARYFALLGIPPTKDKRRIKQAYKIIIKKYHPDVNRSADANAVTKAANEAYKFLENVNLDGGLSSASNQEIYNMLAKTYSRLIERDYNALRNAVGVPVERWYFEQEVERFLAYKQRVAEAYKSSFSEILKLRHNGNKLIKSGKALERRAKSVDDREKIENIIDSIEFIRSLLNAVYASSQEMLKEISKAAEKQSTELRSKFRS
jgi:curved DNA-binding protein CbpA